MKFLIGLLSLLITFTTVFAKSIISEKFRRSVYTGVPERNYGEFPYKGEISEKCLNAFNEKCHLATYYNPSNIENVCNDFLQTKSNCTNIFSVENISDVIEECKEDNDVTSKINIYYNEIYNFYDRTCVIDREGKFCPVFNFNTKNVIQIIGTKDKLMELSKNSCYDQTCLQSFLNQLKEENMELIEGSKEAIEYLESDECFNTSDSSFTIKKRSSLLISLSLIIFTLF